MNRNILRGAFFTVGTLFGGIVIGVLIGDLVFKLIPGSSVENVKIGHAAIASIPAFLGFLVGGAAWGRAMGRLTGSENHRRLAMAGVLGFAPITLVLAVGLGVGEPAILAFFNGRFPIHRIFTLLFTPSAFLIAGVSSYALGRALDDQGLARALFWRVGLAAGAAFLTVNLAMEAAGWVIGGPRAAERFTMVTVLFLGMLAAAVVGGGVLGLLLNPRPRFLPLVGGGEIT